MLVTKKMLMGFYLFWLCFCGGGWGVGGGGRIIDVHTTTYNSHPPRYNQNTPNQLAANNDSQFTTPTEQTAFRQGYDAGYAACSNGNTNYTSTAYNRSTYRAARRSSSSRRVYYDYGSAPRGRS